MTALDAVFWAVVCTATENYRAMRATSLGDKLGVWVSVFLYKAHDDALKRWEQK